jgi:8-oxo-dGTP pyrophosphatase MutT (NUDIX family)
MNTKPSPASPADDREQRLPVSIKAVVGRSGHVALLKNERDEWELPGGKLEAGERPEDCAVREVKEELGWEIELEGLLDVWVHEIRPDRTVFVVTYGSRLLSDHDPIVSHEHNELRLVPVDEVDALNLPVEYKRSVRSWAERHSTKPENGY